MVSYIRKFYLASHSRNNPQQNSSFVCLMNVALPQVHQHKFLLLRTVRVRASLVCWVLSWNRISSSSHAKFQIILIMLVGRRDTNNAFYLNVFLRIFWKSYWLKRILNKNFAHHSFYANLSILYILYFVHRKQIVEDIETYLAIEIMSLKKQGKWQITGVPNSTKRHPDNSGNNADLRSLKILP